MRNLVAAFFIVMAAGSLNLAFADKYILKSGVTVEGETLDQGDDYLKIRARSGAIEIYNLDEVKYVKKDPAPQKKQEEMQSASENSGKKEFAVPPQNNNQYSRINEQIGGLFSQSAGPAQKNQQGSPLSEKTLTGGPMDKELNNLSGNMNDIVQMYQQMVGQIQNPALAGAGGGMAMDPSQTAASLAKQYQDAMGDLDKTVQSYQDKN